MARVRPETLHEVKKALAAYGAEVDASGLAVGSKESYRRLASYFVRWLRCDYQPPVAGG